MTFFSCCFVIFCFIFCIDVESYCHRIGGYSNSVRYFLFICFVVVCYLLCQLCLGFKGCLEISCKKTSDKPPTSLSKLLFTLWFNFHLGSFNFVCIFLSNQLFYFQSSSCFWSYFDHFFFCILRGWDLRNTVAPVLNLEGHQYAVRRVKVR